MLALPKAVTQVATMEFPCGALALKSPLYIERPPIESLCYQNLEVPGSLTRIKGPRQTGKSSLLVRLLAKGQSLGYQTAVVDFQSAEEAIYSDLSRFLRWFCKAVARQLKLPPKLDEYWDEDTGAKLSATIYFEDYLLEAGDVPIVLALNEVNRVFQYPDIVRDFLPLLRFWYEQARQENRQHIDPQSGERQAVGFQKLRTLVVHSTEVYVPLNIHQSPFNVGLPITLEPFDEPQAKELAGLYDVSFAQPQDYKRLRALVGGHPYLLSVAFYYLGQGRLPLDQLLAEAPTPAGIFRHHLQAYLDALEGQSVLVDVLHQVVTSQVPIEVDVAIAHQLSSLGLVHLEGNTCRPACELYRLFFAQHGLKARLHTMDLQRLTAENEELKTLANLDGLTHIANRRVFDEEIKRAWQAAVKQQSVLSLIMLDIDFFKLYNDSYGHLSGDFCLTQVAAVLRDRVRKSSDTVARYGGEEFAIILPETDLKEAAQIAIQLRDGIRALNIAHSASKLACKIVTLSIGVASVVPQQSQFAVELIAAADAALYVSKQQGRDRITISNSLVDCPFSNMN